MKELEVPDYDLNFSKVVGLHTKGVPNDRIAKETHLTRLQVTRLIEDWRIMAREDLTNRAVAKDLLAAAVVNHDHLIDRGHWGLEEAEANGDLKTLAQLIKTISDIEARRVELVQKAGLLDNEEMVKEMLEQEERNQAVLKILVEVSKPCPNCGPEVGRRLKQLAGEVPGEPV